MNRFSSTLKAKLAQTRSGVLHGQAIEQLASEGFIVVDRIQDELIVMELRTLEKHSINLKEVNDNES